MKSRTVLSPLQHFHPTETATQQFEPSDHYPIALAAMQDDLFECLSAIYREARTCSMCFDQDPSLLHGHVGMPQLRWVGPDYAISAPRTVVVLQNPGTGTYHGVDTSATMRSRLQAIEPGNDELLKLMNWMKRDMANWRCVSDSRYTMMTFYTEYSELGLTEDTIAFVNLALCGARRKTGADNRNVVEPRMLNTCMKHHSLHILRALDPEVVLLGGTRVASYRRQIKQACPAATFIEVPHYALRAKDRDAAKRKLAMARVALSEVGGGC